MEKSQLDLCLRVLRKLHNAGVLDGVIIIGSWALYFYQFLFNDNKYVPDIRTRDIDFLVPMPPKFKQKVDIPDALKELGFIINFRGEGGYIRLDHPELIVEFLIPELGKGREKPYPLPNLGLNAQPLRFLSFLTEHTITVDYEGMKLKLPHPAAYALHKVIVFGRRKAKDKAEKDKEQAIQLLKYLAVVPTEHRKIRPIFDSMHPKWRKNIISSMEKLNEKELISILI